MKKDDKKIPHSKSNPLKFNVTESSQLMDFLMKKLDGISRSKVKRMLANKVVSVDGERTTQFDFALEPGMVVEIGKPTAKERFKTPWLDIVYEDKYLLVINKKEGLLTNSTTKEKDTAQSILNQYFIYTQQRCKGAEDHEAACYAFAVHHHLDAVITSRQQCVHHTASESLVDRTSLRHQFVCPRRHAGNNKK